MKTILLITFILTIVLVFEKINSCPLKQRSKSFVTSLRTVSNDSELSFVDSYKQIHKIVDLKMDVMSLIDTINHELKINRRGHFWETTEYENKNAYQNQNKTAEKTFFQKLFGLFLGNSVN